MVRKRKKRKSKMKQISLMVPEKDLENIEFLIKNGMYPNRAEAIRLAIKDLLSKHGLFFKREGVRRKEKR